MSPLSLVSTTEELLWRKSSGFSVENREYGHRGPLCWPRNTLYPQKMALTSPTSGSRSVSIVHLWTKVMEFVLFVVISTLIKVKFIFSQGNIKPNSDYRATTIMNEVLCGFHQFIQANVRITFNKAWPFPLVSFPVHYSLTLLTLLHMSTMSYRQCH
jgi:hypothetical protein